MKELLLEIENDLEGFELNLLDDIESIEYFFNRFLSNPEPKEDFRKNYNEMKNNISTIIKSLYYNHNNMLDVIEKYENME